ncbi:hypothetical protein CQW23_13931 [Capsicum baccatum]|uniref:Uncharacterized protein n=1 Tax=Capsicum baccatum TaxID=33114 RepID=A0A2G2WHR5_CAPBA|nr:hypothetical protein CQW23_13931 [Capsicum baccatum]
MEEQSLELSNLPEQKLEEIEKKDKILLKKVSEEVEKAKEFTKAKNKRGMDELFAAMKRELCLPTRVIKGGGSIASSGSIF